MERINLFFYYQRIYRHKKNYRRKIHRRRIRKFSIGESFVGKLITDGICVLHRQKNSIGKIVKSCSEYPFLDSEHTNKSRNKPYSNGEITIQPLNIHLLCCSLQACFSHSTTIDDSVLIFTCLISLLFCCSEWRCLCQGLLKIWLERGDASF
jgi:hypothetical protein